MGILGTGISEGLLLKPVRYQWAMDLYDQAVANTWFPNEIQLGEDIADFKKMTDEERHAITFLMSYFNPNELLVNTALAFGVYPYVNAPEAHLYLAKQMWEEANHCMSFEYVLETFPIDREQAYNSHVDIPSMARKEEFEVRFIKRMTEQALDITTTEGKQDAGAAQTVYSRMLAAAFGIAEDPATGGASGPLGCYLLQYKIVTPDAAKNILSLQGVLMKRPSRIHISIDSENGAITRVRVGGRSVLVGHGELNTA